MPASPAATEAVTALAAQLIAPLINPTGLPWLRTADGAPPINVQSNRDISAFKVVLLDYYNTTATAAQGTCVVSGARQRLLPAAATACIHKKLYLAGSQLLHAPRALVGVLSPVLVW